MPRQNRRRDDSARPLTAAFGSERREWWRGEEYAIRAVSGAGAVKEYRCPGCDQLIRAGQPHVVAWPADDLDAGARRHWHSGCWAARERRTPSR